MWRKLSDPLFLHILETTDLATWRALRRPDKVGHAGGNMQGLWKIVRRLLEGRCQTCINRYGS